MIGSAVLKMSEIGRLVRSERHVAVEDAADPVPVLRRVGAVEPELVRGAAFASGVAVASPPNMRSMTLPGSSRTIKKITIETATSVAIIETKRWAKKRCNRRGEAAGPARGTAPPRRLSYATRRAAARC